MRFDLGLAITQNPAVLTVFADVSLPSCISLSNMPLGLSSRVPEARTAIFEFVEVYYNRQRLHSSLGYETPERYESIRQQPVCLAGLAA